MALLYKTLPQITNFAFPSWHFFMLYWMENKYPGVYPSTECPQTMDRKLAYVLWHSFSAFKHLSIGKLLQILIKIKTSLLYKTERPKQKCQDATAFIYSSILEKS